MYILNSPKIQTTISLSLSFQKKTMSQYRTGCCITYNWSCRFRKVRVLRLTWSYHHSHPATIAAPTVQVMCWLEEDKELWTICVLGSHEPSNVPKNMPMPGIEKDMGVFPKNLAGPPKSSILIGFSIINHPFWGTPIFGNTHIWKKIVALLKDQVERS